VIWTLWVTPRAESVELEILDALTRTLKILQAFSHPGGFSSQAVQMKLSDLGFGTVRYQSVSYVKGRNLSTLLVEVESVHGG
jgi:hypothetical protein